MERRGESMAETQPFGPMTNGLLAIDNPHIADEKGALVQEASLMSHLQQSKSVLKFLHARGGIQVCPLVGRRCRTNFCGLGCPAYCTQPTLSAILLAFVLGGLLGIFACLLLLWTFWTSLQASSSEPSSVRPSPSSGSRYSALAGYLDEFRPNDEGHIELTSQVGDLKISIRDRPRKPLSF